MIKDQLEDTQAFQNLLSSLNLTDQIAASDKLKSFGLERISKVLKVQIESGLNDDQVTLNRQIYGSNTTRASVDPSFLNVVLSGFKQFSKQLLTIITIITLIVSQFSDSDYNSKFQHYFFTLMSLNLLTSLFQFYFSKTKQNDDQLTLIKVIRNGEENLIQSKDIVVGDIIILEQEQNILVDGVLIKGDELQVDESQLTGESELVGKIPITQYTSNQSKQSILMSGTRVHSGQGQMIVLKVGQSTILNHIATLIVDDSASELQFGFRQSRIAQNLKQFGEIVSIITFVTLILRYSVVTFLESGVAGFQNLQTFFLLSDSAMVSLTLYSLANPQHFALTSTLLSAKLVRDLLRDNNLVRKLIAIEKLGLVNEICMGGDTILNSYMSVCAVFINGHSTEQRLTKDNLLDQLAEAVYSVVGQNQNEGSQTDQAIIKYMGSYDYSSEAFNSSPNILKRIPFTSRSKMAFVFLKTEQGIKLIVKGSADSGLAYYQSILDGEGKVKPLDRQNLESQLNDYGNKSLRTVGFAFKFLDGVTEQNLDDWLKNHSEEELKSNLTLISIIGLKVKPRSDVIQSIKYCSQAQIKLRIVSGDNLVSLRNTAEEIGLISSDEQAPYTLMEGREFMTEIGGLVQNRRGEHIVQNMEKFKQIAENLKALARASPDQKYAMIVGLRQLENKVAVIGCGTNDAPAIKAADVGFSLAMAGTEIARESSDIIILDDSLNSAVKALKQGRKVYQVVQNNIKYQLLTKSFLSFVILLGSLRFGDSPFNVIQILWVSIFVDIVASLAIIQSQVDSTFDFKPIELNFRNLEFSQSYKLVLTQPFFFYLALLITIIKPELVTDIFQASPSDVKSYQFSQPPFHRKSILLSFLFLQHVLMQFFTSLTIVVKKLSIKCLKINMVFLVLQTGSLIITILITNYFNHFFGTHQFQLEQIFVNIAIGAFNFLTSSTLYALINQKGDQVAQHKNVPKNKGD